MTPKGYEKMDTAKSFALIAINDLLEIFWHTHVNEAEYRYFEEVKKKLESL